MVRLNVTGTKHFNGGLNTFPNWEAAMLYFEADSIVTDDQSNWVEFRGKYRVQAIRLGRKA